MVTVKELIALLEKRDPDSVVILQEDSKGSFFSPLCGLYSGKYYTVNSWSGNVRVGNKPVNNLGRDSREGQYQHAVVLRPQN